MESKCFSDTIDCIATLHKPFGSQVYPSSPGLVSGKADAFPLPGVNHARSSPGDDQLPPLQSIQFDKYAPPPSLPSSAAVASFALEKFMSKNQTALMETTFDQALPSSHSSPLLSAKQRSNNSSVGSNLNRGSKIEFDSADLHLKPESFASDLLLQFGSSYWSPCLPASSNSKLDDPNVTAPLKLEGTGGSLELSSDTGHKELESSSSTPSSSSKAGTAVPDVDMAPVEMTASSQVPGLDDRRTDQMALSLFGLVEKATAGNKDKENSLIDKGEVSVRDVSVNGNPMNDSDDSMTPAKFEYFTHTLRRGHNGLYSCHLCNYTGKDHVAFQSHLQTHYDYHCEKCDYTSRTEGRLKRHIKDFHSDVPPDNFSGKNNKPTRPKLQKCKQCDYITDTKEEFWLHQRVHIRAEKRLECPQCAFVTEYKHHLEYHTRNHTGAKPYKCPKCNYECVNKSMLNSHMKSHTNVYQYRCADCNYATKYCHSLKLHLHKMAHRPDVVLNADGSLPDYDNSAELMHIKRGPNAHSVNGGNRLANGKPKSSRQHQNGKKLTMLKSDPPNADANLFSKSPLWPMGMKLGGNNLSSAASLAANFLFSMQWRNSQTKSALPQPNSTIPSTNLPVTPQILPNPQNIFSLPHPTSLIDSWKSLPKPSPTQNLLPLPPLGWNTNPTLPEPKLDWLQDKQDRPEIVDLALSSNSFQNVLDLSSKMEPKNDSSESCFECKFCGILFRRHDIFVIHMAYHGKDEPFTCQLCSKKCSNETDFFTHINQFHPS